MPRGDASELAASSLFTDILNAEQDEEDLLIKNKNRKRFVNVYMFVLRYKEVNRVRRYST